MPRKGPPAQERFWAKVYIADGCWLWAAHRNNKGYGVFSPAWDIRVYAHRWSYEQAKGPVPEGLELDHLCRNPACVNPDHLEAVTHRENILRSEAPTAINAAKTHCINGHAFDLENTFLRAGGGRQCRACYRERSAARQRLVRRAAAALGLTVTNYIAAYGESIKTAEKFIGGPPKTTGADAGGNPTQPN